MVFYILDSKFCCIKKELMNWADLLHADSGAIIFASTTYPTLYLWLVKGGGGGGFTAAVLVLLYVFIEISKWIFVSNSPRFYWRKVISWSLKKKLKSQKQKLLRFLSMITNLLKYCAAYSWAIFLEFIHFCYVGTPKKIAFVSIIDLLMKLYCQSVLSISGARSWHIVWVGANTYRKQSPT